MIFNWGESELTVHGKPEPFRNFDLSRFDFVRLDTDEKQDNARRYDTETRELTFLARDEAGAYLIVEPGKDSRGHRQGRQGQGRGHQELPPKTAYLVPPRLQLGLRGLQHAHELGVVAVQFDERLAGSDSA